MRPKHMFRCVILALIPSFSHADGLCEGRYVGASEIVDAVYGKYGTLYSGGGHWHLRDNVGASLDLWRLLRDETDLGLRRVDGVHYRYLDDPLAEDGVHHDLVALFDDQMAMMRDPAATPPEDIDAYVLATTADLITGLGPGGLWWRDQTTQNLSEVEVATRRLAQTNDLLEWLQVIAFTSDAGWAYGWHFADWNPNLEVLSDDALSQFEAGFGAPWLVAAAEAGAGPSGIINSYADALGAAVSDCSATPGEYAAHTILRFHQLRHGQAPEPEDAHLPEDLRRIAHEMVVMRSLVPQRFSQEDPQLPSGLDALQTEDQSAIWEAVARTYLAPDIDTLIAIHNGLNLHPNTVRALNSLSVEDLQRFATESGREGPEERALLTVAFSRYFALDHFDAAEALVGRLEELAPEQAEFIADVQGQAWPQSVRLSIILLHLPERGTWFRPSADDERWWADLALRQRHLMARGIDLPQEMRTGTALQRDLETYLRLPDRWGAYRSMRGYWFGYMDRAHDRNVRPSTPNVLPRLIAERPDDILLPFAELVAWEELPRFGPETGAAQKAAGFIVRWADRRTDSWIERELAPQDDIAAALREVVLLARWNTVGTRDGTPLAQQAFEIMHNRLSGSPATQETRHWHACTTRCER